MKTQGTVGLKWSRVAAVLSCALLLFSCAAPPKAKTPELHLFLLAGQSNMAGRGEIDPSDNEPLNGVVVLGADGNWRSATEPYHFDKPIAGAGLAKSFAVAYLRENPGVQIGLIPAACGGSPIRVWQPGAYFDATDSHPWDDAIARTRIAQRDGKLKGILWHQGESDGYPDLAARYEAALTDLISRFRTEFGTPALPVVIGQIGQFTADGWGEPQRVIDVANQAVAAADANVAFVASTGLGAKPDGIHFDTEALREFGQRYHAAYLSLVD
jgi:hypothetical protein